MSLPCCSSSCCRFLPCLSLLTPFHLPILVLAVAGMLTFALALPAGADGEKSSAATEPPATAASESTLTLEVAGMESEACELLVEQELLSVSDAVVDALADHETGRVEILYDTTGLSEDRLIEAVESECSFEVLGVVGEARDPDGGRDGADAPPSS